MAQVVSSRKACTVNPLKMSQPIGAALAFLGLDGCMPVLHGAQGCTSFGLVLFVRHFRETIPLQTTAMNEVTTILGGMENLEQAILNIVKRANPKIICIASTGLTETKGDDVKGFLKLIRARHPELGDLPIVYVSTPDFLDSFQEGWAKAVTAVIDAVVIGSHNAPVAHLKNPQMINVLPGCHLTPADLEELREIIQDFGLHPNFLPDLSGSLDGHVPETFLPTTLGGTTVEAIAAMGSARVTLAIGEQMRGAAMALEMAAGVPYVLADRLTGLEASDRLHGLLAEWSGRPVPAKYRRQRSQLVDAMLDGHFFFGGKRVAIGAEPDLLWAIGNFLTEMGAEIACAVTTPAHSTLLEQLPTETVTIGDLEDLERGADGCDLLITHSHGRQAAERLGIPFVRMGLPMFDRLGAAQKLSIGYRGTRDLIFEIGNVFIANQHDNHPDTWTLPRHEAAPPLEAHR
ncbi:MAG: nitrogenase iron-molybdenum cofactor biosynthesis protein NifN [Gammaproteobacteria bacterium]|nr:nitrogenase iron-molybdenum cofactor biosynthesis protein NifN [Gammaproteobacteria bacterium]